MTYLYRTTCDTIQLSKEVVCSLKDDNFLTETNLYDNASLGVGKQDEESRPIYEKDEDNTGMLCSVHIAMSI